MAERNEEREGIYDLETIYNFRILLHYYLIYLFIVIIEHNMRFKIVF